MRQTLEKPRISAVKRRLRDWSRQGFDLLFAPECALCYAELAPRGEGLICEPCAEEVLADEAVRCLRCGAAVPDDEPTSDCFGCRPRRFHFDRVYALGAYEDVVRETVLRLKRNGQEPLAMATGELIWRRWGRQLSSLDLDAVVPVPMHWRRRMTRGVNGPELLAEDLARRLKLPMARRLLVRRRNTSLQIDLTPTERFRNLKRAFRASTGYHLDAARVLLVDDVLTTGATATDAAKTLKRAGAQRVDVLVLGRAEGHA